MFAALLVMLSSFFTMFVPSTRCYAWSRSPSDGVS